MAMEFTLDHPAESEIRRLRRECQRRRYEAKRLRAELAEAKAEAERYREAYNRATTARVVGL